jgi:ATP phosphoribosyltransferase regulatory subunit
MTDHISRIPAGLRYYSGATARRRRAVEDCAMSVFAGWSYEEIITPSVDYYDLFEHGMGTAAERAFRFTDVDGRLLALRPDVTSSVARAAATLLSEQGRPLRLCYAAPVFRQQPLSPAAWRRESTQVGCELLGAGGSHADLEMLAIAAEILNRLKLGDRCSITLNNVEIFNGIAERLALADAAREQLRTLIDMRDLAELRRFLAERNITPEQREVFVRLAQLSGKEEVIAAARRVITNARSAAALDELEQVWRVIDALGLGAAFEVDLGDVTELDYYTGLVFKIYVRGAGARVGQGGRYDGLTANFGRAEPAIGFALELDMLTELVATLNGDVDLQAAPSESTLVANRNALATFQEATRLRGQGKRVAVGL